MEVEPMEIDFDESLVNHDIFSPELIYNKEFIRPSQTVKTLRNACGLLDCSIADELPPCELLPFTDEMGKRQPQDNQQNGFENQNTHAKPRKSVLQVCDPLFETTVIEEEEELLVNGTCPKLSPLRGDTANLDNTIVCADNNNLLCANGVCQLIALDTAIISQPEVHIEPEKREVVQSPEEDPATTEGTDNSIDSFDLAPEQTSEESTAVLLNTTVALANHPEKKQLIAEESEVAGSSDLAQEQTSEEPTAVLLNTTLTFGNNPEEKQLIEEQSEVAGSSDLAQEQTSEEPKAVVLITTVELSTKSCEEPATKVLNNTIVIADLSKTIDINTENTEILQVQPPDEQLIEELDTTLTLASSSDIKELEELKTPSANDLVEIEQTEILVKIEPATTLNQTVVLNNSSENTEILPELESPHTPQEQFKLHTTEAEAEKLEAEKTINVLEKTIAVENHSPEIIERNSILARPSLASRSPKSVCKKSLSAKDNSTCKLLDFVSPTSKDLHFNSDMDAENEEKMLSIQEMNRMKLELNQTKQELTALTLEHQKKEEVIIKLEAEEHVKEQQRRMEVKQLQEKINELMEKNNCEEILQAQNENQELKAEISQVKEECAYYKKISSEYESSLSTRNCENENLKMEHAVATQHLANIEAAFSDCIVKYERTKEIIAAYTRNEEKLKEALQASNRIAIKYEQRYEMLKSHASSQLDRANNDIIAEREKNQIEINKLNSLLKRMEIKTLALEQSLDQKTKECQALASLYDEIAGSVPKH